jgi:hypothetical protein
VLEIVEIAGLSDQGKSKPYLCRGEDEKLYYVKGQNASSSARCREWIVGNLAKAFGLPVPPFCLVNVSPELLAETPDEWQNIGSGVAFASSMQNGCQWFELGFVDCVEQRLRRDLVMFDWWVRNQDREENNTNLLWDSISKSLFVIDFDASFDASFFSTFFQNYHVFSRDWSDVSNDCLLRADYEERFTQALAVLNEACDNLPLEWMNGGVSSDGELSLDIVRTILGRCETKEQLWREE